MSSPTATAELAADPRVRAGMRAQLEARRRRLAAGERSLGWKLGFGAPAARERLGIVAPLVGFLTDRSLLEREARPEIGGWTQPVLEPEIAVRLGEAPRPGGSLAEAAAAIDAVGLAFELADLDSPPTDVEAILAGNIYHRAVVTGPRTPADEVEVGSLRGLVAREGGETHTVDDPQSATGPVVELVRHVIDLLGVFGCAPAAGELVICGSIVPPVEVQPGDRVRYRLEPIGELVLELS